MWCHPPHSLVCPLVYPLYYPAALYEVHVMSSSPLSSLPSGLPSPLSSCLVWGPCNVIQPVDLLPSSVQHCASTNVNLLQSFTLAVTFCWTRKRIHFPCTYFLQVCFTSSASTKMAAKLYRHSHRIVRDEIITNSPIWLANVFSIYMYYTIKQWLVSQSFVKKKNQSYFFNESIL